MQSSHVIKPLGNYYFDRSYLVEIYIRRIISVNWQRSLKNNIKFRMLFHKIRIKNTILIACSLKINNQIKEI